MKLLMVISCSIFCSFASAQTQSYNDTFAVYKMVLDSILKGKRVMASTAGRVIYVDIYGNYDDRRQIDNQEMEAQGSIFVLWVEPECYRKSVVAILREHRTAFDTIKLEDIVWTRPVDLQNLFPFQKFVKTHKAPLGYSYFENLFKKKRVVRLSQLIILKRLNVAVVKVQVEKRSNKREYFEMIVLRKEKNNWKVLDRTKSNS